MRDDLDNVEWGSLRAFNRMADRVPRLLRGLRATDAHERERAAALLETALTGQGDLYEAAPYAVPFLLRLVRERAVMHEADDATDEGLPPQRGARGRARPNRSRPCRPPGAAVAARQGEG